MTTITPYAPRQVTLTATPDDPRLAALAQSMRSQTPCSPYYMTAARARKCVELYDAGFSVTPNELYVRAGLDKAFRLHEAMNLIRFTKVAA